MANTVDMTEVEWQFDAPDTERVLDWLRVARVPGYTIAPGGVKELHDTYYDTADWRLYRGKFTCRVRRTKDGAELTVKGMAAMQDGIRSRREITEHLDGENAQAIAGATGAGAQAVRMVTGRRPLEALFTIDQRRERFDLSDAYGAIGEIAVDATSVAGTDVRLSRVEVEVKPDAIERAKRFVELLKVTGSLTPGGVSKFEAGLAAVELRPAPTETTLGSTSVTAFMTAGEVAFAVLRKHFTTFLANEPGTRLGEDIEALHDMRVAARRLRAAIQAFRPWLPERFERFRAELGWVAAALGEVRDLDVQLERIDAWTRDDPSQGPALEAVATVLHERRDAARKRMLAVLNARRYDILEERFAGMLRRGSPRTFLPGQEPILVVAPDLIEKRYRRLRKLGDTITPASEPAAYHALRIDGKKLRYALEFVGPIYGRPVTDFAARLTALQDVLGLHQDAEVAIDMLREMATSQSRRLGPQAVLAMGAVSERYRLHAVELRASFPPLYRSLCGRRWKELRKVLESHRPPAA
jgi:CHAD domain-containing protein